jgi:hypothetical protein
MHNGVKRPSMEGRFFVRVKLASIRASRNTEELAAN